MMDNEYAKHELDYIKRYEAMGYTDQYRIVEDLLENLNSKKRYAPEEVLLMKEHRYEGMSNPSDMSLLYVIKTKDGSQGTMLASYGANADNSIHEFMNSIPEENVSDEEMIPPDAQE
ncbi:hypothetical protein [Gelidibacter gilvus]|uniref:Phosphoribosylpyrophosphate synthetase n=1 Tax=Gelidibacter gilvus TaxID=59602 RepID=A0A4Q0XCP3_9FLAO|nr:hypothetical protein [Gelidibacter gilvus]RXJ44346.1 hypothetical protein ESZ48_18275 [Gelidibacter gilvus]